MGTQARQLQELNQLLRGATDTTFLHPGGRRLPFRPTSAYVITLDADTRLPRETAARLSQDGPPLNQPRFDAATGDVREGYAVLQPRVAPSLPVGARGRCSSASFRGAAASIRTQPISDVYQDLFSEGSYAGKGIYESTPSTPRWPAVYPRTRCSATISSREYLRAPAGFRRRGPFEEFRSRYE